MVKGFNLRAFELKQQILNDIQNAKLPITLVNGILDGILNETRQLEELSLAQEKNQYLEYQENLKKKKVKKSEKN